MNFHMNKLSYTLAELLNMLVTAEGAIKRVKNSQDVLAVTRAPPREKFKGKKNKKSQLKKASGGVEKKKKPKDADAKGKCFHCDKDGHWKRNCHEYLATLKDKPSEGTS